MRFVREELIKTFIKDPPVLNLETGRYEPSAEREITISGSIQPISGEDTRKLPEGYRAEDIKTLFSHVPLDPLTTVEFKGKRYTLFDTDDWDVLSAPLRHYKYTITKENLLND